MAIENKYGRKLATVTIDGEEMRPRDAIFVIFNPDGVPVGTISSDAKLMDDVAAAARSYWKNESVALRSLNDGYRIRIMATHRFYRELAATLVPETN